MTKLDRDCLGQLLNWTTSVSCVCGPVLARGGWFWRNGDTLRVPTACARAGMAVPGHLGSSVSALVLPPESQESQEREKTTQTLCMPPSLPPSFPPPPLPPFPVRLSVSRPLYVSLLPCPSPLCPLPPTLEWVLEGGPHVGSAPTARP